MLAHHAPEVAQVVHDHVEVLVLEEVVDLEEILLLEAVGRAGFQVHLDVLPLLERCLHRVDLLHRAGRDLVDEPGNNKFCTD